jgi:hypothetical protein
VVAPRPRRVLHQPLVRLLARVGLPAALVGVVTTGVILAASPGQAEVASPAAAVSAPQAVASPAAVDRHPAGSRALTSARPAPSATPSQTAPPKDKVVPGKLTAVLELDVTGKKYASSTLNVRAEAKQHAQVVGEVKAGGRLSVTAVVRDGYRYVSFHGKGRWVTNKYLSDRAPVKAKPKARSAAPPKAKARSAAVSGGISSKPCKSGSAVERGLTPDAIKVHRAICARYPQVTAFGGVRSGGGNHGSGRAVDNMISNSTVGWQIAKWVRAHAKQLGVSEVIYSQHIWTVQRSSEGWRGMSDRGSRTANHYDHVHVSVYGNRATS